MTDEIQQAEREMDAAAIKLKSGGKNAGAETFYAAAYQRLVRLGARAQLRGKYRG